MSDHSHYSSVYGSVRDHEGERLRDELGETKRRDFRVEGYVC